MSKKRQIFKTGLTILISVFMVSAFVHATTTVGDNVSVGGTLGATGATTLSSTLAVTGASTLTGGITVGTAVTGLTFTGTYTTTAIQVGTEATDLALAAAADHAIDVWTTNAIATAATVRSLELNQTHTGAGVSRAEALASILTSNVAMGSWANAIFGKIDLSTSGSVTGLAGVVCAELTLPGSTSASGGGEYSVYEAEINCPASCDMGSRPVHVFEVNAWGTNVAQIDTVGYLFDLDGFTAAADKFISLTSQTVRSKVGDTARYLVLSQMQDGLGLGNSTTDMVLTAATNRAVDIYTTSALTTGTVRSVELNQTHTGIGANSEALTSILTSNVAMGSWANAIFGKIDFQTSGAVAGLAGVVCAELTLPGSTSASGGGEYSVYEAEINCPASCDMGSRPVHVFEVNAWGTNVAQIDTVGYLFDLDGFTSASGKIWYDPTIRMKVGDATRYLVTSITENKLDLGDSSAGIDIGTAVTGLTFTGAYTTTAIQLGTEASDMALAAAGDHAIDVWTTNALTSGTVRTVDITQTHTAVGSIAEALSSTIVSDVKMGAWANAIFAKIDFSTNGYVDGQAGVVCAELTLPGSTITTGEGVYSVWQAEINCPASCVMNSAPIHIFQVNAWGTNVAQIDTVGYLFQFSGFTSGATSMIYDAAETAPVVGGSIRIKVGTDVRYLYYYDAPVDGG